MNGKKMKTTLLFKALLLSVCFAYISEAGVVNISPKVNDDASAKIYSEKFIDEGAMTEEMIDNCIVLKHEIAIRYEKISKYKSQLDTLKKKIGELENDLKAIKDKLNRTDSKAIAAYNRKVAVYKSNLTEYNILLNNFNEQVDTHRQMATNFEKECQN